MACRIGVDPKGQKIMFIAIATNIWLLMEPTDDLVEIKYWQKSLIRNFHAVGMKLTAIVNR